MEISEVADVEGDMQGSINPKQTFIDSDGRNLERLARNVFITLGAIIVISGSLLGYREELSINLIWSCIMAGVLGSTSSALLSALQRKADGWEYAEAIKFPPETEKKTERFSQRMATFFLYRPVFGIIAGLLVFFGVQTGYFGDSEIKEVAKVIFYSLLSGLFIKSLLDKLKNLFDNLVGSKK